MQKIDKTPMAADEALLWLTEMLPILHKNVYCALQIESVLEEGNKIIGEMENRKIEGADTYNIIRRSLVFDLALHLARLCDKRSPRKPLNERDVASIYEMAHLFRNEACREELKKRARNGRHPSEIFSGLEQDCINSINAALNIYSKIFEEECGLSALTALKKLRNNFLAHSLDYKEDANPTYSQIFYLMDCARDFVKEAHMAIELLNVDFSEREAIFRENAQKFWKPALLREIHRES